MMPKITIPDIKIPKIPDIKTPYIKLPDADEMIKVVIDAINEDPRPDVISWGLWAISLLYDSKNRELETRIKILEKVEKKGVVIE